MTRWIALAGILAMGIAAIAVSERRKVDVPAGPAAVLYLVADTEQELTRMPVRFTRMSDEEEIAIGNELARNYEVQREVPKDAQILEAERYLAHVGSQLAMHAHRKLPYKFHYIPDDGFINAFALPGGHVFVGSGLIALMDSEDELASVIGHEIEHIDHYHCAERVQQEQALRKIPLGGLIAMPVEVFEAGYSKDQEMEADREGTRLAVETGYSANGAIRMFETFQRLYQEYQTKARNPQEELSEVAMQTLSGYFRSHPLPSERIAQVQKLIASENWQTHPERTLAIAYIFWTNRAKTALNQHQYRQAQQLAARSLEMHPDQPIALEVLARAQFAQAQFSESAISYRKLLEFDPTSLEIVDAYAQALAAADRRTAAEVFAQWMNSLPPNRPLAFQIPMAGLALVGGNPDRATRIRAEVTSIELKGDLGWWYYKAGEYQPAADILLEVIQRRPGDVKTQLHLAWTQIELQRLSDAIQTLSMTYEDGSQAPERTMAHAVAQWQAEEKDDALAKFALAVDNQPEWKNPAWVKALYSPRVVESMQQMQDEQERRRKALAAHNR